MIRYLLKQLANIAVFLAVTAFITFSAAFGMDTITEHITWAHLDMISGWNWISLFLALTILLMFIDAAKHNLNTIVEQYEKTRKERP